MREKDKKLVTENDMCLFYENSATRGACSYARQKEIKVGCLLAEPKDGTTPTYVLIQDGQIIYDDTAIETIGVEIDKLATVKEFSKKRG